MRSEGRHGGPATLFRWIPWPLRFYFGVPHGMRYELSESFLNAPTI